MVEKEVLKKNKIKTNNKKFFLIKKIIISLVQILIFIFIYYLMYSSLIKIMKKNKTDISGVTRNIQKTKKESKELENKILLIKRYIGVWNENLSKEQKSLKGVDIDSIKNLFTTISNDNYAMNLQSTFLLPQIVKPKNLQVLSAQNTEINITFNNLTEYTVYYFLNDFIKSKKQFVILDELSIKKVKNVDKTIIVNLLDGKLDYIFETNIKMQLYNLIKDADK